MKPYMIYLIQIYSTLLVLLSIGVYGAYAFMTEFMVSPETIVNGLLK